MRDLDKWISCQWKRDGRVDMGDDNDLYSLT